MSSFTAQAFHELRLALVAVQFLTRVPVPGWVGQGFQADWLNTCVRHFPLVGAGVGAFGAAVLWAALLWWPPTVAAVLAVTATVWLTGAFHEDGLADTFDALGGYVPREKALAIMKDSRIGTYGAAALVLGLGLRAALVATLAAANPKAALFALVAAHALGRTAAVGVMAWLPYAGDVEHAKAKPLALAVPRTTVAVALAAGAALLGGLAWVPGGFSPARGLAVAGAAAVVVVAMRRWLRQRLGGYTGDALGATEQLTEMAVLLVLAAV
jgi:adenosylcobinamide-GDP ribazoletransferase